MSYKDPEKQAAYQREYYKKHSVKYKAANKRRAEALRRHMMEVKSAPCEDCGGRFPHYCMDLHHRDPGVKSFTVSDYRHLTPKVREEIAKCDIVCANCHRERHHGEKINLDVA